MKGYVLHKDKEAGNQVAKEKKTKGNNSRQIPILVPRLQSYIISSINLLITKPELGLHGNKAMKISLRVPLNVITFSHCIFYSHFFPFIFDELTV